MRSVIYLGQVNNSEVGIYALSVHWLGSRRETKSCFMERLTIYFPHPLLHMRTSHNVEGLLFMVNTLTR